MFIGDGTLGEGLVYETLNLASLWELPLLVVLEDNGWSQSTPSHLNLAGSMRARFEAFGSPWRRSTRPTSLEIEPAAERAIAYVRSRRAPCALIIHTYRLCHHSKNDDNRPRDEVEARWALDPLVVHGRRLDTDARARIDAEVADAIEEIVAELTERMIYARALGEALHEALADDERVVVLGEDIADPYGGAFKVTRGLSTAFPERVRTTPISEAAIAGVAAGLALAGYRPIAEVMFGDFLALCFDQILNHITKYEAMYNGNVTCPVVIRMPSGGGRGYGPTHSQSIEKHVLGIPHLRVVSGVAAARSRGRIRGTCCRATLPPSTSSTSCCTHLT